MSKSIVDLGGKAVRLERKIFFLHLFVGKEMRPTQVLVALVDWHLITPATKIVSDVTRDATLLYNAQEQKKKGESAGFATAQRNIRLLWAYNDC